MRMRRPAIGVFVLVAAGTVAGATVGHGGAALAAFGCAAALAAWRLRRGASPSALVAAAIFLLGWSSSALNAPRPYAPPPDGPRGVKLVGTIVSAPECKASAVASSDAAVWVFTLHVESNRLASGEWRPPAGDVLRVRWFAPPTASGPAYGDRMMLTGNLMGSARTPVLVSGRRESRRLSVGNGSALCRLAYHMRDRASRRLSAGIEAFPETCRVLDALMLGYRSALGADMQDLFVRTGTLHLFAISGQHVCMLAGMAIVVLKMVRLSRLYWVLPLAPLLAIYTLGTGADPSAVRACVMGVIFLAAPLFGRRSDGLSALTTSAVLIVLVRPGDLFRAGFILSFTVTAGMIVLVPLLLRAGRLAHSRWQSRGGRSAAWAAVTPAAGGRLGQWLRDWGSALGVLVAFSSSAWLVSTPLTAYYFGRFTPVGLLSNLVVIPVAYLVVLCGCLSLVGGLAGAFASSTFNYANVALVGLLMRLTRALAETPGGCIEVPAPPGWTVWAFMAGLAAAAGWARLWLARAEAQMEALASSAEAAGGPLVEKEVDRITGH
jgi:competence protein ComEC